MMPFYNVYGYLPLEISVATGDYEKRGALWPGVIVVNKDNPLTHVTMDELDRIFGSERIGGWDIGGTSAHNILYTAKYARGRETNIRISWGQLGLKGEWADNEIQTYGYASPGFEVYFERKLFHWVDKWNPNFREYVEPKQAIAGDDGKPVTSPSPPYIDQNRSYVLRQTPNPTAVACFSAKSTLAMGWPPKRASRNISTDLTWPSAGWPLANPSINAAKTVTSSAVARRTMRSLIESMLSPVGRDLGTRHFTGTYSRLVRSGWFRSVDADFGNYSLCRTIMLGGRRRATGGENHRCPQVGSRCLGL
jgi:hypothetical protein